jgi:hypothetical protein
MRNILSSNWTAARIFRVVLGVAALSYGIYKQDSLMGWAGSMLVFMGLANAGCCGTNGCSVPNNKTKALSSEIENPSFEEVK